MEIAEQFSQARLELIFWIKREMGVTLLFWLLVFMTMLLRAFE